MIIKFDITVKVVIPNSNQRHQDWQVLLQRRLPEMLVHRMRSLEQLLKVIVSQDNRNRQPNRAPQTIPSPNPIPKLKHILFRNPKRLNCLRIRAQRNKMLGYMRLVLGTLKEPSTRRLRIRNRLLRRKRLARNNEQRRLGITLPQRLSYMRPIDIGHEKRLEIALRIGFERLGYHNRA